MIMAIENLKEHAERATGLRRPGKRKAIELARMRKPYTVRFKDSLVPNHPRWPLVIYRRAVALDGGQDPAGQRYSPQCPAALANCRTSFRYRPSRHNVRSPIDSPARPEHRTPLSPMLSRAP